MKLVRIFFSKIYAITLSQNLHDQNHKCLHVLNSLNSWYLAQ